MRAVPSDATSIVAEFEPVTSNASTSPGSPTRRAWSAVATCWETFPTATLRPVLAAPMPTLRTAPACVDTMPPRLEASPVVVWVRLVFESLPTAHASPVWISAVPSESVAMSALFEAKVPRRPVVSGEIVAVWGLVVPAAVWEMFPTAALPPVLARPRPALATRLFWPRTSRPPGSPSPAPPAVWARSVSDLLPVAEAAPVMTVAWPSEAVRALPVLLARPPGFEAT
jgi:hypothetical protein